MKEDMKLIVILVSTLVMAMLFFFLVDCKYIQIYVMIQCKI